MKDFDTFIKIAKECGRFGQTNCCHSVAQKCDKSTKLVTLLAAQVGFWRREKGLNKIEIMEGR